MRLLSRELAQCYCRLLRNIQRFEDVNVSYLELLVERIASAGQRYEREVLALLEETETESGDPKEWLIGLMIILAGQLRLEAAIPHLLQRYEVDWDWYNEQIMYALLRIGTESVHRFVAGHYAGQPWYVRNYLTAVLGGVRHDHAVDCILPLIEEEEDEFLRGQLGVALASQFDDRGIAPARALYYEAPSDPERELIVERLFAMACLAEVELPERENWGRLLEQKCTDFQGQSESIEGKFAEIRRQLSEGDENPWLRDQEPSLGEPAFAASDTIVRDQPRTGRNDPCPCGSGKKFKKCCMRSNSN